MRRRSTPGILQNQNNNRNNSSRPTNRRRSSLGSIPTSSSSTTTTNRRRRRRGRGRGRRRNRRRRRRRRRRVNEPILTSQERHEKQIREQTLTIEVRKRLEDKLSALNSQKIEQKWLFILRNLKSQKLLKKAKYLQNQHHRSSEKHDGKIKMLMDETGNLEGKLKEVAEEHKLNLERIELHHRKRLDILNTEFERQVGEMKNGYKNGFQEIQNAGENALDELEEIQTEMNDRNDRKLEDLKNEGDMNFYLIQKRYHQNIYVMEKKMSERIDDLKFQIEEESKKNFTPLKVEYLKYLKLKEHNDSLNRRLKSDGMRVHKLSSKLNFWKAKWLNHVRESFMRNEQLEEEVATLRKDFLKMKSEMFKYQKKEKKKLTKLVKISNKTIEKLKEKLDMGEKILTSQALIEKNETERERHFYIFSKNEDEENEEIRRELSKSDRDWEKNRFFKKVREGEKDEMNIDKEEEGFVSIKTPEIYLSRKEHEKVDADEKERVSRLEKFYNKMNSVKLTILAEQEQQKKLVKENSELKNKLKRYLDGISVNNRVLQKERNSLVMIKNIKLRNNPNHVPLRYR